MFRPDALPGANEIRERYRLDDAVAPPAFPPIWRTPFILSPFGDATPPLGQSYDQLALADITYAANWADLSGAGILVDLYLFETLICITFFFRDMPDGTTQWWWLCKDSPGGPVRNSYGPFPTSLRVPNQAFLQPGGYNAQWGGLWKAALRPGNHYVVPTARNGQQFGSWFMVDASSASHAVPIRVANIGADNALGLPILGSYFLALSSGRNMVSGGVPDIEHALGPDGALNGPTGYGNPLVTQKDLQAAMANPLCSCACTPADIAVLVPGLEATPGWPLPEWTNQVYIDGTTIGESLLCYPTTVFYNDQLANPSVPSEPGRQLSRFINFGAQGQGELGQRQDEILYWATANAVQYRWDQTHWDAYCKEVIPGIGYPRRNFPALSGSSVKGCVRGNGDFGIGPGDTLYFVVSGPMPRPATASIFWWWFMQDQTGVLFSECELATPPDHALSLVDYGEFQRNATWIDERLFPDPSASLPTCGNASEKPKW